MVGPVVPLFACFSSYVSNYHRAVPLLQELAAPGSAFAQFISQPSEHRSLADLSSKLIMPVQRLPRCVTAGGVRDIRRLIVLCRYKLLVEGLFKTASRLKALHEKVNLSGTRPLSSTTVDMDRMLAQVDQLRGLLKRVEEVGSAVPGRHVPWRC